MMLTSEVARLVLFVAIVGAVYITACVMLIGVVSRWLLRLPAPSRRLVRFRRVIFGLTGAGAVWIVIRPFIAPYLAGMPPVAKQKTKIGPGQNPPPNLSTLEFFSETR